MKSKLLGLLAVTLLSGPMAANALTWNWTYTGTFDSGASMQGGGGTFTTNDLAGSSYLITAISGTYEGSSITGLIAPDLFGNNNLLYDGAPQLDELGFSFSANGDLYNFFWSSFRSSYRSLFEGNINFSATRASVPEPGTLALLGLGLAGLGLSRRRKAN